MTLLLPSSDGVASYVAEHLPSATVISYDDAGSADLSDVTFYCLPYMGDGQGVALIERLPSLAVIQSLSIGVDEVLAAVPPGVTLCNGREIGHEDGTADLAVTLILASLRQFPRFSSQQAARSWGHVRTESVRGKRVLLVGYGSIGAGIEQRLLPFGAEITRVSRTSRNGVHGLDELIALAGTCDVLVACIALSELTSGLISAEVLAALPDGALVVNVARGAVADQAALTAELAAGRLSAALDVIDTEPLPAGRPEWRLPNLLITPHIGGDTFDFARRAPAFVADQAERHLAGKPLNNVVTTSN
jgi:phosphoglycerate dehydrogenase-like enzyme